MMLRQECTMCSVSICGMHGIDIMRDGYMWVEWESAFQIEG